MIKIFIFASTDMLCGIYDSHVFGLARNLSEDTNLNVSIISFYSKAREKEVLKKKELVEQNISGKVYLLDSKIPARVLRNLREILAQNREYEKIIFHTHNYLCAYFVHLLKKKSDIKFRHLVEFKGIVPEEHLYYGDSNRLKELLIYLTTKYLERRVTLTGDAYLAVSNPFKNYLMQKHKGNFKDKPFEIYPSVFDPNMFYYDQEIRQAARKELNLKDDDVLIIFTGGYQKWQYLDVLFQMIENKIFESFYFMIITKDTQQFNKRMEKLSSGRERVFMRSGDHSLVNRYLNASDFAYLIRENNIVNKVASPTKFCEYYVTKNKVLTTEYVGDFSEVVEKTGNGIIVDPYNVDFQKIRDYILQKDNPFNDSYPLDEFKKDYSTKGNISKIFQIYYSFF